VAGSTLITGNSPLPSTELGIWRQRGTQTSVRFLRFLPTWNSNEVEAARRLSGCRRIKMNAKIAPCECNNNIIGTRRRGFEITEAG